VLRFARMNPVMIFRMLETLYRTANPEFSVWNRECYTLALRFAGSGYVFTERHGWWD
jgi:hypothetical protein